MGTEDGANRDRASIDNSARRIAETAGHHIVISDLTERARTVDSARDGVSGPLTATTLAVKDIIDVAGTPTTQGSRLYGHEPALRTAPSVAALEGAGAHVVAKVNMHEFAYGVSSANPHFGAVRNPTHPRHTPGGSSGGSAAAVAAGIADLALGTDTSGSVRMPAGCVGVVGLRPRNGVIDPTGVAPLAPSFDTVGPMAFSVEDVVRAWDALLAGAAAPRGGGTYVRQGTHLGPSDPSPHAQRPALSATPADPALPLAGVCIGVVDTSDVDALVRLGAELEPFTIDIDTVLDAFWPAFRAEVSRVHTATFPALADHYDPNVAAKLSTTRGIRALQYDRSMSTLADYRRSMLTAMDDAGLDALATPTLGCPVPLADAVELDYRSALGWYTAPFSALNLPAIAVGNLQVVGRTEADVLTIARAREDAGYPVVRAPLAA